MILYDKECIEDSQYFVILFLTRISPETSSVHVPVYEENQWFYSSRKPTVIISCSSASEVKTVSDSGLDNTV